MLRLIIRKELTEFFRSAAQRWLLLGVAALLGLAFYNGHAYYASHRALTAYSQRLTYAQFVKQGDKNPHTGAHFGFYAFKPTAALAFIETGVDDFLGSTFYLEPHKRGEVKFREASDATGLRRFGFLSIGYFGEFLLPLFIFLICYDSFAKEWENHTMRLLLSTRVRPGQLLLGKLAACLLLVLGVVGLVGVVAGLLLAAQHGAAGLAALLPTLGLYVVFLLIFSTLVTLLGVAVSALARRSSLALLGLASFWLVGVFLVPRLAGEAARQLHPAISSAAFDFQTDSLKFYGAGTGQAGTRDAQRQRLQAQVLRQYGVKTLAELPVSFIPIQIEYFEDADAAVMNQAYEHLEAGYARQNRLVQLASLLSPFAAFREVSMALAATDLATHQEFARQAEAHRVRVQAQVNAYYATHQKAGEVFWRQIPQFVYQPLALGRRLAAAWLALLTLGAWLLAAAGLMLYVLKRLVA